LGTAGLVTRKAGNLQLHRAEGLVNAGSLN
jgi:hypothetical protein